MLRKSPNDYVVGAFLLDDHINKKTNSPLKAVFSLIVQPIIFNECEIDIASFCTSESETKYFERMLKLCKDIVADFCEPDEEDED